MKIAFYSPYFPKHFGGGEKHLLSMALAASHQGAHVTLGIGAENHSVSYLEWRKKYEDFFGLDLSHLSFEGMPPLSASSWTSINWQRQFDYFYLVSDGSFPMPFGKKNILHLQIPFNNRLSTWQRLKLTRWQVIQTNSRFTADIIENSWGRKVDAVIYPLVDDVFYQHSSNTKERIILSVGRFFTQLHSKRQDILISAFAELYKKNPKECTNWRLVLAGSVEDETYYRQCVKAAEGLPVSFYTELSREDLINVYGKATLYWHAAGFGVHESEEPAQVEHFGISTAEAMAAGCVPLVVAKGGQKEVIGHNFSKWSWQTPSDLIQKSLSLISSPANLAQLQPLAVTQARKFDSSHFERAVRELFDL